MSPEKIEQLTKEMHEIVREFSERNGVHALMCCIVQHEIPPIPIIDSAGFTNMSSDELEIIGVRVDQLYNVMKYRESVVKIVPFSPN